MAERFDWPEMAQWFDELQGDGGDLWHRALIFPGILKLIGDANGLDILDVGCGNGSLARILARRRNRVVGVDGSAPIIERARAREAAQPLGIAYHVASAIDLAILAPASFDLVVSCMALADIPDAGAALHEMARMVKADGRCIILIEHPCFDVPGASWLTEKEHGDEPKVSRRIVRYRDVFSDWYIWKLTNGVRPQTPWYHRPLSWYFRAISDAGMAVSMLDEPEPQSEFLQHENGAAAAVAQIPMHVVIEARPRPAQWR